MTPLLLGGKHIGKVGTFTMKPKRLSGLHRLNQLVGSESRARVESLSPNGEPADLLNFLLITEKIHPSGECLFHLSGTAANRGRPAEVHLSYTTLDVALQGAHWLAAKMGVPVIYVRERGSASLPHSETPPVAWTP